MGTELMKKALIETQTLRAGCSKAEPTKHFRPAADPIPGGAGRPKFNQLEMVTTFTYKPSLVRIDHAISSYRGNRPTHTHKQTNTPTYKQTGPITINCAARSVIIRTAAVHRQRLLDVVC